MKKILLAILVMGTAPWSNAAHSAEDFVAVRIEAENFSAKSDGWTLTDVNNIPNIQPDPDPPHNSTASGSANMELLPDTRVNHSDTLVNGVNYWGNPGPGPYLEYKIDIPEPGRYLVYTKAYSSGTEDNGIHVGINSTKPGSGARIQLCSKHGWFWTSGQRTAENHCGVARTIFVDVPAAGVNVIKFYAREDGFEIDQFMLLKETHDGSLECFPTVSDKIRCKNIATNAVDGDYIVPFSTVTEGAIANPIPVDLAVDLFSSSANVTVGDTIIYTAKITNKDNSYTATNAKVVLTLPAELQFLASADCNNNGASVECSFSQLNAGQSNTAQFDVQVLATGTHELEATVTADQNDNTNSNNTDSTSVTALAQVPAIDGSISLSLSTNAVAVGDRVDVTARLENMGTNPIASARVALPVIAGFDYVDLPANCSEAAPFTCQFSTVQPGQFATLTYTTTAKVSGSAVITANLLIEADEEANNNSSSTSVSVITSPIFNGADGQVVIEAEQFLSSTPAATSNAPGWYIVDNQWSAFPGDPDNASPSQASQEAYVELLPDTRIDSNQLEVAGKSNFENGGTGATLAYNVAFFEAGEYYVFARVRANNDQDSVLHVGLNNDWQNTSENIRVCNPDGNWQWTNSVVSGGDCGGVNRSVINVPAAGVYQLMVSQATDGLELDKLLLTTDAEFLPQDSGPSAITLNNPTTDIKVSTRFSDSDIRSNESSDLIVTLKNQSATLSSIGISVLFEGVTLENASIKSGFDDCRDDVSGLVCTLDSIDAQEEVIGTLKIQSDTAQTMFINTTVRSDFTDENQSNNSDSSAINILRSNGGSFGINTLLFILLLLPVASFSVKRRS